MWLLLACSPKVPSAATGEGWSLSHLAVGEGLSGLTVDGQGELWSVSERPAALIRLRDGHKVPLDLPAEPESVEWTAEGFWLGTERDGERVEDQVFRVSATGELLQTLTYRYEELSPKPNHGLEGLCVHGGQLLVAGEDARGDTVRDAPVASLPQGDTQWLRLRSETGKVSALACTETHLYAIERHYEVLHLLRAPYEDLMATEVVEVPEQARGPKVNYEGLAVRDGKALLISDNQGATVEGPTLLLTLTLP